MDMAHLLSKIDRNVPGSIEGSPCWLYIGKVDYRGRAQIWYEHKNWNARRLCYIVFMGDPGDFELRRVCQTKACCRPEHSRVTKWTRGFAMRGIPPTGYER
jgi:hypothetical protein